VSRSFFAPLSTSLRSALVDEDITESDSESNKITKPQHGTVLTLVGKEAFPCVCEVSSEGAHLFSDMGSSVVADGVKWQSLYLVFLGSFLILVEPDQSG
jgi:hypothetical protein